jgi:hypothetical protein
VSQGLGAGEGYIKCMELPVQKASLQQHTKQGVPKGRTATGQALLHEDMEAAATLLAVLHRCRHSGFDHCPTCCSCMRLHRKSLRARPCFLNGHAPTALYSLLLPAAHCGA